MTVEKQVKGVSSSKLQNEQKEDASNSKINNFIFKMK